MGQFLGDRIRATKLIGVVAFAVALQLFATVAGAREPGDTTSTRTAVVEFNENETTKTSIGEILVEIGEQNLLFLTPDGQLRTLLAEDVVSVESSNETMTPLTSPEIYAQFRADLPPGFSVYKTKHYVLVYNTSKVYVEWVGRLFEDLHRRFYTYWDNAGIELDEPRFPLVALVFDSKASYARYARKEIGDMADSMIGYYNLKTNRMVMYDMTGINGLVPPGARIASAKVINSILRRPQAERTVSTIVHEAVHQLSYNSGLQIRLADNPKWVSEGMAMYFEAPDPRSRVGWGALGKVNYYNLNLFLKNLPSRRNNSLASLIADDARFGKADTAAIAYPESWALTYFLAKARKKQYVSYLQELAELESLSELDARERLQMFSKHFGDIPILERAFLKYITTQIRAR